MGGSVLLVLGVKFKFVLEEEDCRLQDLEGEKEQVWFFRGVEGFDE